MTNLHNLHKLTTHKNSVILDRFTVWWLFEVQMTRLTLTCHEHSCNKIKSKSEYHTIQYIFGLICAIYKWRIVIVSVWMSKIKTELPLNSRLQMEFSRVKRTVQYARSTNNNDSQRALTTIRYLFKIGHWDDYQIQCFRHRIFFFNLTLFNSWILPACAKERVLAFGGQISLLPSIDGL